MCTYVKGHVVALLQDLLPESVLHILRYLKKNTKILYGDKITSIKIIPAIKNWNSFIVYKSIILNQLVFFIAYFEIGFRQLELGCLWFEIFDMLKKDNILQFQIRKIKTLNEIKCFLWI